MALAVLGLAATVPAGAALPSTSSPKLTLERTIRTTPFAGTSISTHDGEGMAFVRRDASLWLVGENNGSMFEIDPFTGALKRTIARSTFDSARPLGGGPQAGRARTADFESVAYDEVRDVLYVFSGDCCTTSVLPTVFRLTRDPVTHRFVVESYQPLGSGSDFTAAAWSPRDGKVYVGQGRFLRSYDYASNATGPAFSVSGVRGFTGLDFTSTGADLMAVTNASRMFRIDWSRRTVVSGWELDLTRFDVLDSRAVEVIPEQGDPTTDQLYVFDGYDGRPTGDPLRYAVFVFDVTAAGGASGDNLVGNPGFETNTSGWAAGGVATLSRVSGSHDGAWAARLENVEGAAGTCTLNDAPNWVGSTAPGTYTATMWVKAPTAGAILKLRLRQYAGSTLVGTPKITTTTLTTSWQRVSVELDVTASGSSLDLTAYVPNALVGVCFHADDVSIVHS
jgi:hypothetical protein